MKFTKALFIISVLFFVTACASQPQKNTMQSKNCHQLIQDVDSNNASAGDELLNQCLQKTPSTQKDPKQNSNIWLNTLGEFIAQALNSLS
ncbi:hypothetical protein KO527_08885 [Pseudoalteromonas sp. C2R02]|uniref:hypothetical protein n=1 Tax=Pseudoalteromonas sp. C2R02 TaxID=2841565 RepID=UPI001C09A9B7|nr:hypothetical protein [Pseudoalteromonas sp. C2R02]MBU2969456.1 hypothetical protein [Pseudoalteromonas sp. C2R02]